MSPRSRDEHFDERRQRIAEAAARVFAEKGYIGATNRAIAAAADISPGLIYWYFDSKEDLFLAVLEQLAPARAARIDPQVADTLPLEEFLTRLAQAFCAGAAGAEQRAMFRLVMGDVVRFPQPAKRLGEFVARHPVGALAAYFQRQMDRGLIRAVDPWLAAQAFLGSLVGYAVRKYVVEHDDLQAVDDRVMAATVARLFAAGLTAAPAPAVTALEEGSGDGHGG